MRQKLISKFAFIRNGLTRTRFTLPSEKTSKSDKIDTLNKLKTLENKQDKAVIPKRGN